MRRVLAFYQFVPLESPETERGRLQALGDDLGLRGTILVAEEGVNGTVVGDTQALSELSQYLTDQYRVKSQKWSDLESGNSGFHRFKVRVQPEIVSFGVDDLDMGETGEHVDAQAWNALIADPEVIVIDTRNDYEIDIGTFDRAVSPHTEKASSFLLNRGFENVYQLDGGILQYLEDTPAEDSRWQGECFVFDQRVSVNANLQQGQYKQCYACRHPLSEAELASPDFEHGVSCPHCIAETSAQRREQFRERQHQVRLAAERGEQHIGLDQKKAREQAKVEAE